MIRNYLYEYYQKYISKFVPTFSFISEKSNLKTTLHYNQTHIYLKTKAIFLELPYVRAHIIFKILI